jgi:hypothetical protein
MISKRALQREDGQAIVIFVVFIVVLLGFCALVLDVGHAYLAQRRLQSSTDAAALAGAQALPSPGNALTLANQYGNGGANTPEGVDNVQMNVTTKCLASAPGCTPANAIVVQETGSVATIFGKLFGIDTLNVHASATACSPCSSMPLDIMLVLDRTGSMCQKPNGADDHPACSDMANARSGLNAFLKMMDPKLDRIGFAVLPPALIPNGVCPYTSGPYLTPSDNYVLVPLGNDYASSVGVLNPGSALVKAVGCVQPNGTTSYANAIEAAQAELVKDGRAGVQKVIVFETDGAANTGPTSYPNSSPYRSTPCQQGVNSSAVVKSAGTLVYSIGYDLAADRGGCKSATGSAESSPNNTPMLAVKNIASPGNFYNQPTDDDLSGIYRQVAADLGAGSSRLIDDSAS